MGVVSTAFFCFQPKCIPDLKLVKSFRLLIKIRVKYYKIFSPYYYSSNVNLELFPLMRIISGWGGVYESFF